MASVRALRILLLDVRGVPQHDLEKLGGRPRAMDVAVEALLRQQWKRTGVIDVRMAQHDGVDRGRGNRERLPVAEAVMLQSLEEAAIQEHSMTIRSDEVLRARDRAGGAQEAQRLSFVLHCRPITHALVLCKLGRPRGVTPVAER
jgi:hypothetical protein